MTDIDPLKIPAFMRRRRPLKDTSFKPTPKFKVNPSIRRPAGSSLGMTILNKQKPLSPVFELPLIPQVQAPPTSLPVGIVTHYYDKIKVAVLKLSAPLETGVKLQLMGEKGAFVQNVRSMQINRQPVAMAPQAAEIGIKVKRKPILGEIAYQIY